MANGCAQLGKKKTQDEKSIHVNFTVTFRIFPRRLSACDCSVTAIPAVKKKAYSPQRGSYGWFWQTRSTAGEIIKAHSQAFIFPTDNSTLRGLLSIIYFHPVFQGGISLILVIRVE